MRHAVHQSLVREPVGDELGDGDECEAVLRGEPLQVRAPRHRPVGVEDLADHTRGVEPREPGEVDTRLGLTHALQHATRTRAQREDVPGPAQVTRHAGRIDRDADRRGPVTR